MWFETGRRHVSVVIPCLDEADAIGDVVRDVLAEGVDEVIVVDNGSTDDTAARAAAAGARVVGEPQRGYGRACAAGVAAVTDPSGIVCFIDGDGSDVPSFLAAIVGPVARDDADFVMGSRMRGVRERGSMTPQQRVAGRLAGWLIRLVYRVRFTDMSPFRAATVAGVRGLRMNEMTFGWNLEMQLKAAAAGWRVVEIPVDHRLRRGGVSKVSGDLVAGLKAAWVITRTFVRLAATTSRRGPDSSGTARIRTTASPPRAESRSTTTNSSSTVTQTATPTSATTSATTPSTTTSTTPSTRTTDREPIDR